jgi:NADP-dependent 3-hydroxy acid dehydrogenase YdfG
MSSRYLVTGASRGLGAEFVRQLRARGHDVVAGVRDPSKAGDAARAGAKVMRLDVDRPDTFEAFADSLDGPVDVLINNAGIAGRDGSVRSLDPETMARVYRTNVAGPALLTRALLPALRRGGRKLIAHVSSGLGSLAISPGGFSYAYCSSKAALNMLTVLMHRELSVTASPWCRWIPDGTGPTWAARRRHSSRPTRSGRWSRSSSDSARTTRANSSGTTASPGLGESPSDYQTVSRSTTGSDTTCALHDGQMLATKEDSHESYPGTDDGRNARADARHDPGRRGARCHDQLECRFGGGRHRDQLGQRHAHLQGKTYPISVEGLSVGDAGITRISASGEVYGLTKLEDFNGTYAGVVAGAAVGGGGSVSKMQNQNGVRVDLVTTTQGLKFTLGANGVNMKIKQ